MCSQRRGQKGSSILEFTLVGVPLIFLLISTCEMARGMWSYHTMAYAIKEGARYAVVHGKGCTYTGNSCSITVGTLAQRIASLAIGLDPGTINVTLVSANTNISCQPVSSCFANPTVWPPADDAGAGMDIRITGNYLFRSALAMFWPQQGAMPVGTISFPADSRQRVQF